MFFGLQSSEQGPKALEILKMSIRFGKSAFLARVLDIRLNSLDVLATRTSSELLN